MIIIYWLSYDDYPNSSWGWYGSSSLSHSCYSVPWRTFSHPPLNRYSSWHSPFLSVETMHGTLFRWKPSHHNRPWGSCFWVNLIEASKTSNKLKKPKSESLLIPFFRQLNLHYRLSDFLEKTWRNMKSLQFKFSGWKKTN